MDAMRCNDSYVVLSSRGAKGVCVIFTFFMLLPVVLYEMARSYGRCSSHTPLVRKRSQKASEDEAVEVPSVFKQRHRSRLVEDDS